jgi:hypothetical protein
MNYRRGLQRVYAALTIAWIVATLLIAVRDRPTHTDWIEVPPKGDVFDQVAAEYKRDHQPPTREELVRYCGIQGVFVFGPPVAGYLLFFGVVPWIYRGFKPGTQT